MNTKSAISRLRKCLLPWTLGVVALASASQAFAQGTEMRVNVPFAFHNGSQVLPAGVYTVSMESQYLVILRGPGKSGIVSVQPQIGKPRSIGRLVFQRYGNQYFLHEVWPASRETGARCLKSSLEREMEIAQRTANQPGSQLALNQQR